MCEIEQQLGDARHSLAVWEMLLLVSSLFLCIFSVGNWELGPFLEDGIGLEKVSFMIRGGCLENECNTPYLRRGSTLKLGFYLPRQIWFSIFAQDEVDAERINIFRVNQEAIHVKKTCSDRWKAARTSSVRVT